MMRRLLAWFLLGFLASTALLQAQVQYRYSYIPKKVYLHQVFAVTILAVDAERGKPPTFRFDPRADLHPLEKRPLKVKNGSDIFYTFYFKAERNPLRLPDLWIQDEEHTVKLPGRTIPVETLHAPPEERFCGVIASDFTVRNSQVSTFDDKNNLVYLEIEAHEANLEDMQIPGVVEGGMEKFHRRGALASGEYYFVIPANVSEIRFSYYNAIKQQFVPLRVSTSYESKNTAAQVDLNPKDSSFTKLKKYTFAALSIFFLLMFISSRDLFYLILFVVTVVTLVTFFMPLKKICVQEGAPLYILPIPNSTVGMRIDRQIRVPELKIYGDYSKIEYQHGITGWIRHEDLCKD
ncbi:hypothetical protein [Nitratifractor sp.]